MTRKCEYRTGTALFCGPRLEEEGYDKRYLGMGMRVGSCLTAEQSGIILGLWDLNFC